VVWEGAGAQSPASDPIPSKTHTRQTSVVLATLRPVLAKSTSNDEHS